MEATGWVQVCAGEVGKRGLGGLGGKAGVPGGGVPSVWEGELRETGHHLIFECEGAKIRADRDGTGGLNLM